MESLGTYLPYEDSKDFPDKGERAIGLKDAFTRFALVIRVNCLGHARVLEKMAVA